MTQKQILRTHSIIKILSLSFGLLMGLSSGAQAVERQVSEIRTLINVSIQPHADKNPDAVEARREDAPEKLRASSEQFLTGHYLVQFHEKPISQLVAQSQSDTGMNRAGKAFKQSLETQRNQLDSLLQQRRSSLEKAAPDLKVLSQHSVLFTGLHVQTTASHAATLALRSDVKAVFPVKKRYLSLDASHQVTKTQSAWQALGGQSEAGKGINIAVVDTGIRNENPMFADSGFTAPDLSGNGHLSENPDYCRSELGDASFCNNKLIVARAMDPAQHGMEVYSGEYLSPKDFDGHGTHVAGIAAGNPVMVEHNRANAEVSGAAPGAYLMVYKALYMSPFGFAYGTDSMLLEALEMAVLDGADIINNSWGAGSGEDPDASIYQDVFANAEALGIVVVNAAGNTGHPGATINCPACIESGIAVANSTHGRFFGNRLTVNDKSFLTYQGVNNQLQADLSLTLVSLDSVNPLDDSGCEEVDPEHANGDLFTGQMVLVDYKPFCTLEQVAGNMAVLGAEAVLIYQDSAFGMATYEPFIPFEGDYEIPVFGLSRENGLKIEDDAYTGDFTLTITNEVEQGIEPQYVDIINPFSSTGPNNDPSVLKPDMSAPGTFVLSAYSPDDFDFGPPPGDSPFPGDEPLPGASSDEPVFAMLTGTSMASPQVAGAAALLRQQYPDWSAQQIKSALMSTSAPDMLLGIDPANAFVQGAGRLDTLAALNSKLDFTQVSYSHPGCIGSCIFINQLKNLTDSDATWTFDLSFFDEGVQGVVEPEVINFSASGETQEVRVTIDTSRADPEHVLYDKWVFGRLTATNDSGETQHLPLVAYANDASDVGTLVVAHDGTNLQSQNEVVYQTRVRNKGAETSAELVLSAPENATFLSGSEAVILSRSSTESLELDPDNQQLIWRGTLQAGSFDLQSSNEWGDFTLANAEVAPIPCFEGCNGFNSLVEFNFEYNDQAYSTLTISDNGFVVPGSHHFGFLTALFNQRFPQEDALNNIIAPFWTEFDLLDETIPDDTGGGYLRAAVRVIDEINYLVVEWDNVQPFVIDEGGPDEEEDVPEEEFPGSHSVSVDDDPLPGEDIPDDETPVVEFEQPGFTFQIIIQENTDNIWFNYLQIPYVPEFLSIGAENMDGTIGINRYFDGEGIINLIGEGESNISEQLTSEPEGSAIVEAALTLTDNQDYAQPDTLSVMEDEPARIDVMANDLAETFVTLNAELQLELSHKAISTSLVPATSGLQAETLEIVTVPANGEASFESAELVYSPTPDFFGEDKLTYRVADGAGKFSKPVEVTITVSPVNDAPVMQQIARIVMEEGETSSFSVAADDIDSAVLTYNWEQTAGEITSLEQTDNQFQITAPDVAEDTTLTYNITASDGELTSEPKTLNIDVKAKGSGGSLFWLLAITGIIWIYRKKYLADNFINCSELTSG